MRHKTPDNKTKTKRATVILRPKKVVFSHAHDRSHKSFLSHSTLKQRHATCKKKIKALLANNKALAQSLEGAQCDISILNKTILELQRRLTLNKPQVIKSKLKALFGHFESMVVLLQEVMDCCDKQSISPLPLNDKSSCVIPDSPSEIYFDNANRKSLPAHPKSGHMNSLQSDAKFIKGNMSAIIEQSVLADDLSFPPILFSHESDHDQAADRRTLGKAKFPPRSKSGSSRRRSNDTKAQEYIKETQGQTALNDIYMSNQPDLLEPKQNNRDLNLKEIANIVVEDKEVHCFPPSHETTNEMESAQNGKKSNTSKNLRKVSNSTLKVLQTGPVKNDVPLDVEKKMKKGTPTKFRSRKTVVFATPNKVTPTKESSEKTQEKEIPSECVSTSVSISELGNTSSSLKPNLRKKRETFTVLPKNNSRRRDTYVIKNTEQKALNMTEKTEFPTSLNMKTISPRHQTLENKTQSPIKKSGQNANLTKMSHTENELNSNNELYDMQDQLCTGKSKVQAEDKTTVPPSVQESQAIFPSLQQDSQHNVTCVMIDDMELTKPLGEILTLQSKPLLNSIPDTLPSGQTVSASVQDTISDIQLECRDPPKNLTDLVNKSSGLTELNNNTDTTENNTEHPLRLQPKSLTDASENIAKSYVEYKTKPEYNSKGKGMPDSSKNWGTINKHKTDNCVNAVYINEESSKTEQISKKRKSRKVLTYNIDTLSESNDDDSDPDYQPTKLKKRSSYVKGKSTVTVPNKKSLKEPQSKIPSLTYLTKEENIHQPNQNSCSVNPPSSANSNAENNCTTSGTVPSAVDFFIGPSTSGYSAFLKKKNKKADKLGKGIKKTNCTSLEKKTSKDQECYLTHNLKKLKDPIPSYISGPVATNSSNEAFNLPVISHVENNLEKNPKLLSKKNKEGKLKRISHQKEAKLTSDNINEKESDKHLVRDSPEKQQATKKRKKMFTNENNSSPQARAKQKEKQALTPKQLTVVLDDFLSPINKKTPTLPFDVSLQSDSDAKDGQHLTDTHEGNMLTPVDKRPDAEDEKEKLSTIVPTITKETGRKPSGSSGKENMNINTDSTSGRRNRRTTTISYKEPSLNVKLRREDVNSIPNLLAHPLVKK